MNKDKTKYDEFGVPYDKPWPTINKNDVVCYVDVIRVGRRRVFKYLYGVWDGEKVEFDDVSKTIVRTKRWLRPIGIK